MTPFDYAAPRSLAEAVRLLAGKGTRTCILAGGTDILVQLREGKKDADLVLDIKSIPELGALQFDPERGLTLGAAVPCCRIYEDPLVRQHYPALYDAVSLVGGIQIQSRASVGGNLCNASPAADTAPALMAYEARCLLAGPAGQREIAVEEFFVAPGRTALAPEELLVSIQLPVPMRPSGANYQRFIPRNEMDIAVVGVGAQVVLDPAKSKCVRARIALAAVAPTPLLAAKAASALEGQAVTTALIDRAAWLAQQSARPISDMRGDADYRLHLVGVLTKRTLATALERAREN